MAFTRKLCDEGALAGRPHARKVRRGAGREVGVDAGERGITKSLKHARNKMNHRLECGRYR